MREMKMLQKPILKLIIDSTNLHRLSIIAKEETTATVSCAHGPRDVGRR